MIPQDDVVMGTLTVRENFAFSAALRLPSSVSTSERNERVKQVIKDLGLGRCADTKVEPNTLTWKLFQIKPFVLHEGSLKYIKSCRTY